MKVINLLFPYCSSFTRVVVFIVSSGLRAAADSSGDEEFQILAVFFWFAILLDSDLCG